VSTATTVLLPAILLLLAAPVRAQSHEILNPGHGDTAEDGMAFLVTIETTLYQHSMLTVAGVVGRSPFPGLDGHIAGLRVGGRRRFETTVGALFGKQMTRLGFGRGEEPVTVTITLTRVGAAGSSRVEELEPGTGSARLRDGDGARIRVTTSRDGVVGDGPLSHPPRGIEYAILLGDAQVTPAIEEALVGRRPGARLRVTAPWHLSLVPANDRWRIGPGETIFHEIEVLEIVQTGKVVVRTQQEGTGPAAGRGDLVAYDVCIFLDGFGDRESCPWFRRHWYILGSEEPPARFYRGMVPGILEGLRGARAGEIRHVTVPFSQGHGLVDRTGEMPFHRAPPFATLYCQVEVTRVIPDGELRIETLDPGLGTEALQDGWGALLEGQSWSLSFEDPHPAWTAALHGPMRVALGRTRIPPGLQEGLLGMRLGERRRIEIPPHLLGTSFGAEPRIDEGRCWEVTLTDLRPPGELHIETVAAGSGGEGSPAVAGEGSRVSVELGGWLDAFDGHEPYFKRRPGFYPERPHTLTLGATDQVYPPALHEALIGMRVGEVRRVTLPWNHLPEDQLRARRWIPAAIRPLRRMHPYPGRCRVVPTFPTLYFEAKLVEILEPGSR
jgi:FKBP-type peptidyl-prolyl cis-trans isomerase 2